MMNCLLITLAMVASAPTPDTEEVVWVDDYAVALEEAKELQKPLLIVIDDPSQSQDQSQQAEATLELENAALLEDYVLCHVDVTTDYGKRVADVFKVKQYPSTAIIDKTGEKIIYRKSGQLDDEDWATALGTRKRETTRTAARGRKRRSDCDT